MGRSPGEKNGNSLQYSYLENAKDGGAWQAPWGGKESDMTKHDDRVRKYFVALVAFLNINIDP